MDQAKRIGGQMLSKLLRRNRRLRLDIDGRRLTFVSLADFEFCLSSRTEVPASKIVEMVRLSALELLREATQIREVEKRFVQVLAKALEEPRSVSRRMKELGHKVFSQDHEWRSIVAALNRQEEAFGGYKKVALVKYLQYLGARQDVLKSLYSNRAGQALAPCVEGAEGEAALKETVIFDVAPAAEPKLDTSRFERLPKGETVAVRFPQAGALEIMLSRHRFKVVIKPSLVLQDDSGNEHPMAPGRNTIGRDSSSEVVIDSRYRDVSRSHLVIEQFGDDSALFTDLSSHGTFVPITSVHLGGDG